MHKSSPEHFSINSYYLSVEMLIFLFVFLCIKIHQTPVLSVHIIAMLNNNILCLCQWRTLSFCGQFIGTSQFNDNER